MALIVQRCVVSVLTFQFVLSTSRCFLCEHFDFFSIKVSDIIKTSREGNHTWIIAQRYLDALLPVLNGDYYMKALVE